MCQGPVSGKEGVGGGEEQTPGRTAVKVVLRLAVHLVGASAKSHLPVAVLVPDGGYASKLVEEQYLSFTKYSLILF